MNWEPLDLILATSCHVGDCGETPLLHYRSLFEEYDMISLEQRERRCSRKHLGDEGMTLAKGPDPQPATIYCAQPACPGAGGHRWPTFPQELTTKLSVCCCGQNGLS